MISGIGGIKGAISRLLVNRLRRKPSAHGEQNVKVPSGNRHVEPAAHSEGSRTEYGREHGAPIDAYTKLPVGKKGKYIDNNA